MIHYNNNRPFVEGVSLEDIAKTQDNTFLCLFSIQNYQYI